MSRPGPAERADQLRRAIYGRDPPDRRHLAGLITLAAADPHLLDLVADVARDALLTDGQISVEDEDWLMEVCGDGRGLPARAPFVALTSVLRHATEPAAELVAFAAREIERAILTGERAPIGGADGEAGRVLASDVAALAGVLAGARPDRALAEVLFDIAHATATAANDPGFDACFVRTLRGYLASVAPGARFDDFLAALREPAPHIDGLGDDGYGEAAQTADARGEAVARSPASEARWAFVHLSRGALSSAERRLIAALRDPAAALRERAA